MGLREGKLAQKGLTAYYNGEAEETARETILRAASVLRQRSFGNIHFDSLEKVVPDLRATPGLLVVRDIFDKTPEKNGLQNRLVYHQFTQMVPLTDHPDHYKPYVRLLYARQNRLLFSEREMPIVFDSEHIELQHLRRTATCIDYSDDHMVRCLILGCFLAMMNTQVVGEHRGSPFALPGKDGLYLGYSMPTSVEHRFNRAIIVARDPATGRSVTQYEGGTGDVALTFQEPPTKHVLLFKTFVGQGEMFTHQRRIYTAYQDLMNRMPTNNLSELLSEYGYGALGAGLASRRTPIVEPFIQNILSTRDYKTEIECAWPAMQRYMSSENFKGMLDRPPSP